MLRPQSVLGRGDRSAAARLSNESLAGLPRRSTLASPSIWSSRVIPWTSESQLIHRGVAAPNSVNIEHVDRAVDCEDLAPAERAASRAIEA
jgi:hypothetical protein